MFFICWRDYRELCFAKVIVLQHNDVLASVPAKPAGAVSIREVHGPMHTKDLIWWSCQRKIRVGTHHRAGLRSSSLAWLVQSYCGESCWACQSTPPFLPHCLQPAGRCSYPASSAQRRTGALCCSERGGKQTLVFKALTASTLVFKVLYLNNTHARVEEDSSFGFLGRVLILVEVEVVGSISQLGQIEVSSFEGLDVQIRGC